MISKSGVVYSFNKLVMILAKEKLISKMSFFFYIVRGGYVLINVSLSLFKTSFNKASETSIYSN
jgi:hypothetical protein